MIYKNKDINTNINEKTVELGNIGAKFYTEDEGTASIRIFINWNNKPVDLNKINMKPVLSLFMQDGSIFEGEKVEVILAEKGLIQYKIPSNVIKHVGKVNAKLFLVNDNESIHVANFNFNIIDSGVEGAVAKEIKVEVLEDMVEKVLLDNADNFKGDKGDKGDRGMQGIQGEQGIQGIQGLKGDTGSQGIQGVKGEQGPKGDTLLAPPKIYTRDEYNQLATKDSNTLYFISEV